MMKHSFRQVCPVCKTKLQRSKNKTFHWQHEYFCSSCNHVYHPHELLDCDSADFKNRSSQKLVDKVRKINLDEKRSLTSSIVLRCDRCKNFSGARGVVYGDYREAKYMGCTHPLRKQFQSEDVHGNPTWRDMHVSNKDRRDYLKGGTND